MYAALWRLLPGPLWAKTLLAAALLAAALYSLAAWVFPWVDQMIASEEVTVEE